MFRSAFSTRTYYWFCVLVLVALLTTGRHTVTNILRTVRGKTPGHMSTYHSVFSQRRWSAWGLAHLRWVYVHDCTGTHRDEYFLTTDIMRKPQQIVAYYTQRESIQTLFQECREDLQLESTTGDVQQPVLRLTPCLFGLYTTVVRLYLQLPCPSSALSAVVWRGKSTMTFSDMMTCVRRA